MTQGEIQAKFARGEITARQAAALSIERTSNAVNAFLRGLIVLLGLAMVAWGLTLGCAHLTAVETTCHVTIQDLFDVATAALSQDYDAALTPGALGKEWCVIKASAHELLGLKRPPIVAPATAVMMSNLTEWSTRHQP